MARRDPNKSFRAPAEEMDAINRAIAESGLPDGVWIRAMLLAAAGESKLLRQLKRAQEEGGG